MEKGSGGHFIMSYDDRRVQVTAPRRKALTPWKALREAAEVVGVDLQEFLQGPTKKVVPTTPAGEIRVTHPCGCMIDEHGWFPCGEHAEKEPEPEPEVTEVTEEEKETVATEEEVATTRRRRRQGGKRSPIVEVIAMRGRKAAAPKGSGVEIPEMPEDFDLDLPDEVVARKPKPVGRTPKPDEKPTPKPLVSMDDRHEDRHVRAERIVNRLLADAGYEISLPLQRSAYSACVAAVSMLIHTVEDTDADADN